MLILSPGGAALLDAKTADGQTALHLACEHGHSGIVMELIDRHANVMLTDKVSVLARLSKHAASQATTLFS